MSAGYDVVAGDLFPEDIKGEGIEAMKIDLEKPLPFPEGSFDGVLFSEGIEHLDAQVRSLQEMARILKPGGVLIVTTPNILNLANRVNAMLIGHDRRHSPAVVTTGQYWGERPRSAEDTYFGHAFLINAFQLRFYLEHVGLEVLDVDTTQYSRNSVLAAPLMYPAVWWATKSFLAKKKSRLSREMQRSYLKQVLSPHVLFGKKLIMVARKPASDRAGAPENGG